VIDAVALQMVLGVLTGWVGRREREAIAYLIEENRLLRRQLRGRRLHLTDDDRRRLAARAYRLGRAVLREVTTIATPDTVLRWHRQLIARRPLPIRRRFRKIRTLYAYSVAPDDFGKPGSITWFGSVRPHYPCLVAHQ